MNDKKFLGAPSAALTIVIAILILVPGAQGQHKPLYNFTGGTDGSQPYAGLVFDQAGNLYGTTLYGGGSTSCYMVHKIVGCGVVFKLAPNADGTWNESVLYRFTGGADGAFPEAGVIFDVAGNLYGTTSENFSGSSYGGTVFKLTPNADGSWTESTLYNFCSLTYCADGAVPTAGLIFDTAGNLYGTTTRGGNSAIYGGSCYGPGCGTVFKLAPNSDGTWSEGVLYNFCSVTNCGDGADPSASLILDAAGSLYGTASGGGIATCGYRRNAGCGVVFKLIPNRNGTWKEKVLHYFTGGWDGGGPQASLIFDTTGNLYSTTRAGGDLNQECDLISGCGVVFKLTPNSSGGWKEETLHSFTGSGNTAYWPEASLIFDAAGNLYGTASPFYGEAAGEGVVFKLTPNSNGRWKEKVLALWPNLRGAQPAPHAGLIFDSTGNLYGTTDGYNRNTFGSVFEITP